MRRPTKQAAIDAACLIVGSAVGAAASTAFLFHRFMRARLGAPHGGAGEF